MDSQPFRIKKGQTKESQALLEYCKVLGQRRPVYSYFERDGYDCTLAMPYNSHCPILRSSSCRSKRFAFEAVSREACNVLVGKGILDEHSLTPLRASPGTPTRQEFGNRTISAHEQTQLGLESIPLDLLREALTTPSEGEKNDVGHNWCDLGKAFIKFYLATYFFARCQHEAEGPLTTRIQNETCPKSMSQYMLLSGLVPYVRAGQNMIYTENTARMVFHKVVGVAIQCGGTDNGIKVLKNMGFVLDQSVTTVRDIQSVYQRYCPPHSIRPYAPVKDNTVESQVQNALTYQFRDPNILRMTIRYHKGRDPRAYQRLELLGDAILDFIIHDHYHSRSSEFDLGKYRQFKGKTVSNFALGSLLVSLGINTMFAKVRKQILDPSKLRITKSLGDAMESLIGAVFVDAGFDLGATHEMLSQTLIPFVERGEVGPGYEYMKK
ncbi:Dicer-like protein 2 [Mortierella sp. AD011]|nr:Dicer-like protein 2 [Mortierella sp. AD010]KAF9382891.1 Dicer-like protein 2 [Mortierella sp. AD011]